MAQARWWLFSAKSAWPWTPASLVDQFAGQGTLRRIPEGTHPPAATPGAPVVGPGASHVRGDSNRFVAFSSSLGPACIVPSEGRTVVRVAGKHALR